MSQDKTPQYTSQHSNQPWTLCRLRRIPWPPPTSPRVSPIPTPPYTVSPLPYYFIPDPSASLELR
eukprot:scaffold38332_cov32-Attheya_sp.AAC.1